MKKITRKTAPFIPPPIFKTETYVATVQDSFSDPTRLVRVGDRVKIEQLGIVRSVTPKGDGKSINVTIDLIKNCYTRL